MRLLISILINGLIVSVLAYLLSGVQVVSYLTAMWVGLLLGVVNFTVLPIMTLLTLPLTILSLGLFLLVINGLMVLLVDFLVPGFNVDGIFWAILFAVLLILGIALTLPKAVLRNPKPKQQRS